MDKENPRGLGGGFGCHSGKADSPGSTAKRHRLQANETMRMRLEALLWGRKVGGARHG
jgi:hypothetical protein